MLKIMRLCFIFFSLVLFAPIASASLQNSGFTFSYVAIGKDPDNLHGYRGSLWYQPEALVWKQVSVYFAGSAGHWWSTGAAKHHSLNIFAIAPVLRFYIAKTPYFDPYAEISLGASYLTKTRFDDRNLGMHFAFQDEFGLGAAFGKEKRFNAMISALHYSNGSMCAKNAGITAPVMLTVGYRFG